MDIRVLGEFGVHHDRRRLPINPSKVSGRFVAALAATDDLSASHAYIVRRIWPKDPPVSAMGRIRQAAAELRREAPGLLPNRNEKGHCSLAVAREQVDYLRFRDQVHAAQKLYGAARRERLRAALEECQGAPLEDFPGTDFDSDRNRILRQQRSAWILYLKALIKDNQAVGLLQEISEPMLLWVDDEELFMIKLDALKITDGSAQVKRAWEDWVRAGHTISTALSRHYQNLIGGSKPATRRDPGTVPRQLSAQRPIIGRAQERAELDRHLLDTSPAASRLVVIHGMPGVGKTATANGWVHSAQTEFTDGVLAVELDGYCAPEPKPTDEVLAYLLAWLGVQAETPTRADMVAAYRTAMASRNILLLLDDARNADQVRPLLPGRGRCAVLVTSRDRLDSLMIREAAHAMRLDPLPRGEAVELLAALGRFDPSASGDLPGEVARLCGDHPLSLVLVGAMIHNRELGDLWKTRAELADHSLRVSELRIQDDPRLDVTAAFTMSHRLLSTEAKKLFWNLAVHPGPTISRAALAALAGEAASGPAIPSLDELRAASLVEEPVPGRYAFHDLTREFAEAQAGAEPAEERARVAANVYDFLIHNAWSCDRVLVPGRSLPLDEPVGFTTVAPASVAEAMEWLTIEYPTLKRAVGYAVEAGMHRHTWLLAMTLVTFQWRANRYQDAVNTLTSAAKASETVASPGERSMVHRMLAGTYRGRDQYELAKAHAKRALVLAGDDPQGVVRSQNSLAILLREMGELHEASRLFREVLIRFRQMNDVLGEAGALNGLGCIHLSRGELEEAQELCDNAVRLFATTGDINGHANALVNRGRVYLARGEPSRAAADLSTALSSYRKLSYPRNEANTLVEFAVTLAAQQRTDKAREMLLRAEQLFNDLDAPTDEINEQIRRLG